MAHVEVSIRIGRPMDEVFTALTNIDRLPEWVGILVASEQTSDGPIGVGTTIGQEVKILGRQHEGSVEITSYDPPHRLEQRFSTGPLEGTMRYALTPRDGATEVLQEVEAKFTGALRPPDAMLAAVLKRDFQGDLERLKLLLEREIPAETSPSAHDGSNSS